MIGNAWFALVALGMLTAAWLCAGLLIQRPALVVIITGVYVLIAWDVPVVPPITTVMGTSIYFVDYLATLLFLVSFPRLWRIRSVAPAFVACWLTVLVVLALSLLRGLAANGLGTSVNDFRSFFYVVGVFQWALTLDWDPTRSSQLIDRGSQVLGWALVAVFAIHVAIRGLGSADEAIIDPVTGDLSSSRPLNSGQALVLVLCAMLGLGRWLCSRSASLVVSAGVFLLCVVLAQNRSTWAAAVGALVVLVAVARFHGRARLISVLTVGALAAAFVISTGALGDVVGKLAESLNSSGTYDAREDSWQALIHQQFAAGDPLRILFGSSMGDGYDRIESSGRLVQYAPHNWYVTIFLRAGIVGLAAFVVMMVVLLVRALRHRDPPVAAVITAMLLYGWAYSWNWYQMIFMGWAASMALALPAAEKQASGPGRARPKASYSAKISRAH